MTWVWMKTQAGICRMVCRPRSSMHDMGGTVSMRTVLQKINTHEIRLECIEKQFHELVGVIQQIVGVGRG